MVAEIGGTPPAATGPAVEGPAVEGPTFEDAGFAVAPSLSTIRTASARPSPVAARSAFTAPTLSPLRYWLRTFATSAGSRLTSVGSTRFRARTAPTITSAISAAPSKITTQNQVSTRSDEPRIATLMRSSVLELFPMFYDERQTLSAATYIAHVDRTLIDDGTY